MKKTLSLLIATFVVMQLSVGVAASFLYEGEDFSVSLPDGYNETSDNTFVGESGSFTVNVAEYGEGEKYSIYLSSDKDLKGRARLIADTANAFYETQSKKAVMEVVSTKKFKHPDGKTAAVTVYKTSSEDTVKNQIVYEFTCVNNLYTFTYTGNEAADSPLLTETFDSVVINEKESKGFIDNLGSYVAGFVMFGLMAAGIIRFIRTPAKRKKGKL